jgi:hypothetical protein
MFLASILMQISRGNLNKYGMNRSISTEIRVEKA